ncbi:ABC transporter ATP-binding protein [Actinomadura logoneensis]|uniref:ABC transporter ATP-binding protein n=1 Tax=Actinomadura logoneensis TaxID=2293572 RepID=A0A372JBK3_9ACTN|nr:ABC transporter ATP-binding protein [Actinomadura logoneensis]RFU37387.1 ABC transporter ATP-binding protein [Actinomadura logoneensis]
MDAVEMHEVGKSFGAVRAVDRLSLRLAQGQTVALLGPNGAGKSTAISMMLGLRTPDTGTVRVLGGTPDRAVRAGRVGAMPQTGRLVGGVKVRELVGFAHRAHAAVARGPMPSLDELMDLARISDLGGRRADALSGGQAQRVRFALAMAGAPDLVVLDEPTAALDIESRHELWAAIRACAGRGATVLFSTHYLEEADAEADRIVVVDRGRVVADGTSEEIKRRVPGRTVSIDASALRRDPADLPGVLSSETDGRRLRLHTTDADATVLALATAGAVRDLEVTGASLEQAFLTLTHTDPIKTDNTQADHIQADHIQAGPTQAEEAVR